MCSVTMDIRNSSQTKMVLVRVSFCFAQSDMTFEIFSIQYLKYSLLIFGLTGVFESCVQLNYMQWLPYYCLVCHTYVYRKEL